MNFLIDDNTPLVSVIIVNFNGKAMLGNCLKTLVKSNYPNFEIVIVDNGSRDDVTGLVESYSLNSSVKINLIKAGKNLGFAEANNIGVRNTSGKYVALLNNDTVVDSNWLQSMVNILENSAAVGAVQSLLLTSDGLHIDSVGGVIDIFGTAEDKVVSFSSLKKLFNGKPKEIFSACAAAELLRRDVFESVGGFDSRFFAYYEDVDLSWRIRLRGYSIVLDTNSIVYHARSGTSKKFTSKLFHFHLYKNQIAMVIKNYEWKNIAIVMPGVLSLYLFRLANSVVKNDANLGLATFKALCWNIKEFRYLSYQREYIQTFVRRVGDDQVTKFMSKRLIKFPFQNDELEE